MDPILEQFLSEARENLSYLDQNLAQLADGDDDELNALFRAAHTLKGGAGLVGLEGVKMITHHAEDLLDGLKKKKIEYSESMLDVLYEAFDEVIEQIDAAEELGDIPVYDEDAIDQIVADIKAVMGAVPQEEDKSLHTELNIVVDSKDINIGELIAHKDIDKFISEIPFSTPEIDNDFIENDNFYLIDMDLDTQTCEFGNDPVYLIYLLEEQNVYTVSTYLNQSSVKESPTEWFTRLTLVVRSSKDMLEDSLYNIIDDIVLYPLSVQTLLSTTLEQSDDELFDDFAQEFQEILNSGNYDELSEKLSAATKVLNPDSKEGFILNRLQVILPNFEFEGVDYLETIKYVSSLLNLNIEVNKENISKEVQEDEIVEDTQEDVAEEEIAEEEVDNGVMTPEKQNAINILQQQLKVIEFSNDDSALSRVKLFVTRALDFIGKKSHFDMEDDKESVKTKIQDIISSIDPTIVFQATTKKDTKSSSVSVEKKPEIKKPEPKPEIKKPESKKEIKKVATKEKQPQKHQQSAIPKTVKIDQSDIDSMMDIVGELLVMKNSLPYVANNIKEGSLDSAKSELMAKYEEISRVTQMLQDKVMGMRLLPMSYIFSRYPKLVRDTSKMLGKKIKFEDEGGDTKLDKMMIEKIADPLVHIIRNSLDHGIEENEQARLDAGKDSQGHIKISAKSVGDKVEIKVEDDGRGIDVDKVLVKAMGLGIVTEEQINSMSEQEKLMMIFNPGLSTKDEVSELSGRGVGTDAVKRTIDELGGKIFLESKRGLGTTLSIELPVSVALTNVFHIKMGKNNYAIAMEHIVETIKIKKDDIQIANQKPFARLRGEIVPLIFEPILLPNDQQEQDVQSIVIIQGKTFRYGLVVNEFVNQLDVVQKPLDGILHNHPMVTGTSLLGNGDILFILDPNKIVGE